MRAMSSILDLSSRAFRQVTQLSNIGRNDTVNRLENLSYTSPGRQVRDECKVHLSSHITLVLTGEAPVTIPRGELSRSRRLGHICRE